MADIISGAQTASIKITTKSGSEIDITQSFLAVNLYQSIQRKFITGRIVLADTNDMLSNFPLIGDEKVNVAVQNNFDSSSISYNFLIYKVDRDPGPFKSAQKIKVLTLYLYTEEEKNSHTRISKKYTGTSDSVVQDLVTNNLISTKSFNTTTATSELEFVANFWDFEGCMEYINNNSKSSQYYDYIFFENLNGYHFQPLSYLFAQAVTHTVKFALDQEQFIDIDNILRYQFNTYFNDSEWRDAGMFGSTGYKLDIENYEYTLNEETIVDIDARIKNNGANRLYNQEQAELLNRVYCTYEDDQVNLTRTTHLNFLTRYNFIANLNGDLGRNVGDIYTIEFPNLDNESASGSDSYGGNWLVSEINTEITQNNDIKQNIEFVRNALFNNIKLDKF